MSPLDAPEQHAPVIEVGGPYFEDLTVGQIFDTALPVTLTDGLAAAHQAILGDRLRLPLDQHLARAVTGGAVAHPGLVTDVAIGQSTIVTHHVKANLFYRGLTLLAAPRIGDTLTTRTEVVGLKRNSVTPGRPTTGLAALRMTTTDQDGRIVLDFHRCAMLPLSAGADPEQCAHSDDLTAIGEPSTREWKVPAGWDLDAYRAAVPTSILRLPAERTVLRSSADVVTSAPELARLTLNVAETHHDERIAGGHRLVYGGHTIGLALAQASRAVPSILTVLGWHSCDHVGPVREGDTLSSDLTVGASVELPGGGAALDLRSVVHAHRPDGDAAVLDWSFTVLVPREAAQR